MEKKRKKLTSPGRDKFITTITTRDYLQINFKVNSNILQDDKKFAFFFFFSKNAVVIAYAKVL